MLATPHFSSALNLYLDDFKFKNAEAHNLRLAFEQITGQDLNWYWNQWYFGSGHPVFDISYNYDDAAKMAKVVIKQVQNTGKIFRIPMAIDDAQLGSIERGGMFETLRTKHGAAVLDEVQRVKTKEEQAAFNQMHKGEFRGALEAFSKAGGIVWAEQQEDALRGMAEAYTADHAADPTKRRFMIAATNAEVDALNDYARRMREKRGELGEAQTVKTNTASLSLPLATVSSSPATVARKRRRTPDLSRQALRP